MKKYAHLILAFTLAGLLAACNLPGATTLPPTKLPPTSLPATLTTLPPTPTSVPVTATLPSPTVTPSPTAAPQAAGPAVILEQIHMLNTTAGWGWASKNGLMSQLLRTSDGGQTWKDVSPQGDYTYLDSFFLNAQNAWLPFFKPTSNTSGLLRTTDGGQTWTALPSSDMTQNAVYNFTSPNDGLAETYGVGAGNAYLNYYQTHDGGVTWKPILLKAPKPESGLPPGTVHLCNICGDQLYYDASRALITYGELANEPSGKVQLALSTDLGQNWKTLSLPLPDPKYAGGMVGPLPVSFFGNEAVLPINIIKYNTDGSLAFSILALYASQDGGKSWKAAPAILESKNSQISNVQVLSPQVAFSRCDSNLCSTSDGAKTWKKLPDSLNFDQSAAGPDYVSQFAFVDPSNGWAISGDPGATTLWKSTDGGASWTKLAPTLAP